MRSHFTVIALRSEVRSQLIAIIYPTVPICLSKAEVLMPSQATHNQGLEFKFKLLYMSLEIYQEPVCFLPKEKTSFDISLKQLTTCITSIHLYIT